MTIVYGSAVYIRPFTYAEPGIGVGISRSPWVIIVTTPVGAYFKPGNSKAITTRRVRANPGGTGWIKSDSNYVTSALAKKEAEAAGFMEAVFLDAKEHTYFEEGSSCNIFFVMKDGTLVTPSLEDTILPGITRRSVMVLAREKGMGVEERRVSVKEVFCQRAGVLRERDRGGDHLHRVPHARGQGDGVLRPPIGEVTRDLLKTLKGIQYGAVADTHGWMFPAT